MSRDDLIQLEGVVTKIMGYGTMEIECDDNEAVIDTNYRRLIDGRSIDISLGGIHNIVVAN